MPRTSHEKVINNKTGHNDLTLKYIEIIDRLQSKYGISDGSDFNKLINFQKNKTTPKHNWYEYKQGYADELVELIIKKENPNKDCYVLDPFSGVGTTNLVSQSLGYKSIGVDINPVATLAAMVKTAYYSTDDISKIKMVINNFNPSASSPIIPEPKVIVSSFADRSLKDLYKLKGFYEKLEQTEDKKIANFFKLAFLSIIEDCSIRTKDGNGLKLNPNKKAVSDVFQYYLQKCRSMLNDISISNYLPEAKIIQGSLLIDEYFNQLKNCKVGISVYSPPYANCFDYCEVYKLEFWLGGFVKGYDGFKYYRDMAMRSHVNSSFNHSIKNSNEDVNVIADLISTYNIWNKNIPDMIRGYFDDTFELLKRMKSIFIEGASCYIVVANSAYKGILVPTDLLIADIANRLGYKVEGIMLARKIRSSSQQMDELQQKHYNLTRESIVVIRK